MRHGPLGLLTAFLSPLRQSTLFFDSLWSASISPSGATWFFVFPMLLVLSATRSGRCWTFLSSTSSPHTHSHPPRLADLLLLPPTLPPPTHCCICSFPARRRSFCLWSGAAAHGKRQGASREPPLLALRLLAVRRSCAQSWRPRPRSSPAAAGSSSSQAVLTVKRVRTVGA